MERSAVEQHKLRSRLHAGRPTSAGLFVHRAVPTALFAIAPGNRRIEECPAVAGA
jgi:hypothetical protein